MGLKPVRLLEKQTLKDSGVRTSRKKHCKMAKTIPEKDGRKQKTRAAINETKQTHARNDQKAESCFLRRTNTYLVSVL